MENGKRLIDANALKRYIKSFQDSRFEFIRTDDFAKAMELLDCAPAVDAVEVVRCKDCRFYEEAESSLIGKVMCCTGQGDVRIQKQANDFCSYGERRE